MVKYVNLKEKEHINEVVHEMKKYMGWMFSWTKAGLKLKRAPETVKRHYDKDWCPGKYFTKPTVSKKYSNDLEYAGLYLLAQQVINNGQIINLVKVGKSTNIKKRLLSYQGTNPFVKCISTLRVYEDDLDRMEKQYHALLGAKNSRYGNTEWFICSDEEYEKSINHTLSI